MAEEEDPFEAYMRSIASEAESAMQQAEASAKREADTQARQHQQQAESDEVDPLDAFMASLEAGDDRKGTKRKAELMSLEQEEEEHAADQLARKRLRTGKSAAQMAAAAAAIAAVREKNAAAAARAAALAGRGRAGIGTGGAVSVEALMSADGYDSDEEVYAAAKALEEGDDEVEYDEDGNPVLKVKRGKHIASLPPVDHSRINYPPFRKVQTTAFARLLSSRRAEFLHRAPYRQGADCRAGRGAAQQTRN